MSSPAKKKPLLSGISIFAWLLVLGGWVWFDAATRQRDDTLYLCEFLGMLGSLFMLAWMDKN